ncbi:hypothetical protein TrRE_jg4132 [Triparma retinervis]|uniref:Uncharacterized protein n=1 Tax=Triparma retinervis TaxID=2557542 RepID=A0A9W7A332_9STRA|nr:hypothetical protein TrRE_jg4132 [Triparma retinervis]
MPTPPTFTTGEKVLYALDSTLTQYTSAVVVDVHYDDSPPYYTISYMKQVSEGGVGVGESGGGGRNSRPKAGGTSLGPGAQVRETNKTRMVKSEKQTTAARLKKR